MDITLAIQLLSQLIGAATTLLPEIEKNIAAAKAAASTTDAAALDAQITAAHADILALTAQLDALKDA